VERLTFDTGAEEFQIAIAHDGGRLAVVSNLENSQTAAIRIWNLADGTPQDLVTLEDRQVHCLAFSPDGKTLAVGGRGAPGEPTLLLLDSATGNRRETLPTKRDVIRLAFSPDGRRLVTESEPATVQMWQLADRALEWTVPVGRQITCFGFSPDGKQLAGGDTCGRVWLWSAADGAERLLIAVGHKWIWSLAFSSDGATLATAANSRPIQLWDVSILRPKD
jgi:WD40 repeat protein